MDLGVNLGAQNELEQVAATFEAARQAASQVLEQIGRESPRGDYSTKDPFRDSAVSRSANRKSQLHPTHTRVHSMHNSKNLGIYVVIYMYRMHAYAGA